MRTALRQTAFLFLTAGALSAQSIELYPVWIATIGPQWTEGADPLRSPRGIGVSLDGRVFVADLGNDRVVSFDSLGAGGRTIGYAGAGEGRFVDPADVATEGRHLYVLDEGNERVQIFNRHDVFSEVLLARESGTIGIPSRLAVDLFGRLYVSDVEEDVVRVYRSYTGEEELRIGGYGSEDGLFVSPGEITVDRDRNIYVCDRGNARVQKFDPLGGWLMTTSADGSGALQDPSAIAVDRGGRIYVADSREGRIVLFERDGSYRGEIRAGPDGRPLSDPQGLAFGPTGIVYLVESGKDRIVLFRPPPDLDVR
ncbi:MAG: hypothetical protein HKN20_15925 [Gemmatimonadetes bacterium]|nr:hypothetical protein [Gemmatimonadota bacterium]